MPLSGSDVAAQCLAIMPDLRTVALLSRGAADAFTATLWTGQDQPASKDELAIAGAIAGERWRIIDLYRAAQTSFPKELDQLAEGANLWILKSIGVQCDGWIYRCRGLAVGAVTAISITPTSLSAGTRTVPYSATLTASGGIGTKTFAVTVGTLPPGLTLSSGGTLSGTPTTAAVYAFTVTATDILSNAGSRAYSITIN